MRIFCLQRFQNVYILQWLPFGNFVNESLLFKPVDKCLVKQIMTSPFLNIYPTVTLQSHCRRSIVLYLVPTSHFFRFTFSHHQFSQIGGNALSFVQTTVLLATDQVFHLWILDSVITFHSVLDDIWVISFCQFTAA